MKIKTERIKTMELNDFRLEVYFGKHEFSAPYLLAQSDCQSMTVKELLSYEKDSEKDFLDSWLGYTEVLGNPELRHEVSLLYKSINLDEIMIHSGAQEAIFNYMNVMLKKEDHVIVMYPTYQSLFEVANSIGCDVSYWKLKQGSVGWEIDVDELKDLIKPNTKLICINTPNNPTGYTFKDEEIDKIVEIADSRGINIFSDEVYKGLELDGVERSSLVDKYEKSVSLGVMSKAYGLAGLRIGWIVTKDKKIFDKMTKFKHYTTICNSSTSEYLAKIALKHGGSILEKNIKIIRENLKISDLFFDRHKDLFIYNRPMCGPIAFHKLNTKMNIRKFCDKMVEEKGILLLPADMYLYEENYFRIGYGRLDFEENLKHFEEYLTKYLYNNI
jgi:aspartate/methionine/tyrosine aminotransferase